jgi:hypothetical protein
MSIAKPSIARNKLRQERQGEERHQHSPGHAPNSRYAAPNGAWSVFRCSFSINMALLTELSPSPTPLKTAKNAFLHSGPFLPHSLRIPCESNTALRSHPVAATATLDGRVKTSSRGRTKRAVAAPTALWCVTSSNIVVSFRSTAPPANELLVLVHGAASEANTALHGERLGCSIRLPRLRRNKKTCAAESRGSVQVSALPNDTCSPDRMPPPHGERMR